MTVASKQTPSRADAPRLSVIMPVHNALPHLDAAVQSILNQTHRDFEFVIYDDASTDGSTERLREWAALDSRIRLFEGRRNLGAVGSSTFVVEHSVAPLIARMDADDVSLPNRFEEQMALFDRMPDAGLVGTLFEMIDERGRLIRGPDYWRLAPSSPFAPFAAHGSIMFRRSVFDRVGGYRAECEFWEDQDLVVRMACAAEAWVLPRALYKFRQWTRKTPASSDLARVEKSVDTMYRSITRLEQNEWYDDLLAETWSTDSKRVDPRVFMAAGSRVLWAGGRPRVLGRLLRRGRLRVDLRSVTALIWATWAVASPSTLRTFLKMLLRSRNRRALRTCRFSDPVRWSPMKARPRTSA